MEHGKELCDLAAQLYGADPARKPAHYLIEYDRLFHEMRDRPISLLELGVYRGASMQMWKEYFPKATVVGLDALAKPDTFPSEDRFRFIHGAQDDPKCMDQAIAAGGPFDIIIDDASHLGCHTGRSFAYLFPRALRPGGIYVIEDICTAFLAEFDGAPYVSPEIGVPDMPRVFPSHQHGNVGMVKQLVDHAMAPTLKLPSPFAIEKITILRNIAIIHKSGNRE
jgi:hypothetical protein